MKNYIFYLLFIANVFNTACSQNKPPISIEQVPSKYSTVLFADLKEEKITGVRFYLTFDIANNTNKEVNISFPEYIYNKKYTRDSFLGWTRSIHMYSNKNGKLEPIFSKEMDGLEMLEKNPKEYVFTTFHSPIKDAIVQSMFSIYLEKMKKENKDTLHIGTISELKANDSSLLKLLEGDSIIISLDKKGLYIDPIPIQIK